jgi:TonB family protein
MECLYENNVQISCTLYDQSGKKLTDNLKTTCEVNPTYKNKGLEYFREVVQKEMIYPPYAVENGIYGRVIVQFVVTSEGKIGTVHVLRGVHESLDNECIRAIKATKPLWTPGYDNGKPVSMIMVMPLIFQLQ